MQGVEVGKRLRAADRKLFDKATVSTTWCTVVVVALFISQRPLVRRRGCDIGLSMTTARSLDLWHPNALGIHLRDGREIRPAALMASTGRDGFSRPCG
jgi:hypothetical protein